MLTAALSLLSGGVVGCLLGLFGGGGSILAVPLMIYVVGIADVHVAVGTSAVAVAASALINLVLHARSGSVKWPCASAFAASGVIGAFAGAELGQRVDGNNLLVAFSVAMVGVGVSMLRRPKDAGNPDVHINPRLAFRLIPTGLLTGVASGFFGIGGGFLIVPGLMAAANMTILNAVGSSLVAVSAFAAAGAVSYAAAGLVAWDVAAGFILGGLIGGFSAQFLGRRLAAHQSVFAKLFAALIFGVAGFIFFKALS